MELAHLQSGHPDIKGLSDEEQQVLHGNNNSYDWVAWTACVSASLTCTETNLSPTCRSHLLLLYRSIHPYNINLRMIQWEL